MKHAVAIVGMGPRGLFAFERLAAHLRFLPLGRPVEIHLFNRTPYFGAGEMKAARTFAIRALYIEDPYAHRRRATRSLGGGEQGFGGAHPVRVELGLGAVPADPQAAVADLDASLRSLRDGVFSAEQVERGLRLFEASCGHCHQPQQFTGPGFIDAWAGQTVDVLFAQISTTMPEDNPSSLKKKDYTAILAYLFSINGLPTGEEPLPSGVRRLQLIRIDAPADSNASGH